MTTGNTINIPANTYKDLMKSTSIRTIARSKVTPVSKEAYKMTRIMKEYLTQI